MASLLAASTLLQGVDFGKSKQTKDIPVGDGPSVAYTSNDFGFRLFKRFAGKDQTFFSPISLSQALAMTSIGAKGKTAEDMATAMGFKGQSVEQIANGYSALAGALTGKERSVKLNIANSIWVDNDLQLKSGFANQGKALFGAEIASADFRSAETLRKINQWCYSKTEGRIPSIIDRIDPMMKMYLFNALYFKGEWMIPFPSTYKDRFNCIDGTRIQVEMMIAERYFQYYENDYFRFAEIPYKTGIGDESGCSMIIALPKGDFLKARESLDASSWEAMYQGLESKKLDFKMPKFSMAYEAVLNDVLTEEGMGIAFSSKADFGGISEFPLAIGTVKQKTYINVDENGLEAAAITAIGMRAMSARPEPSDRFFVDKPFIYAICDKATGAILFIGQKVK